jgi:hypothetical protein
MVFMAAETIPGFAPLGGVADDDVDEMDVFPSSQVLDIRVQLHKDAQARRIHIGVTETDVPAAERDHANGNALFHFVKWALGNPPPTGEVGTMLVLWGHAYQFAVGQTPTPGGAFDALDFAELANTLRRIQKHYEALGYPQRFDIVGFDACDLATVEVALQLQPYAQYLLASEMGIPLPGWPYDRVLDRLAKPKDSLMGPAELGSYAVRRYCEAYQAVRAVSLTLLNLGVADQIAARAELLARRLAIALRELPEEKPLIMDLFARSQTDDGKPFVDVADLCLNLARESSHTKVKGAALALGDLLITPGPVEPGLSHLGLGRPFIQEHGRNAVKSAKLNGVSLYAPHVVGRHDFEVARGNYERFVFGQSSLWTRLVHNLAASI